MKQEIKMANEPSKACMCNPAAPGDAYLAKGTYQNVDGLKLYVTGPASSKAAIVFVYDVYGYSDQNLIGADMLSELTSSLVIMPDILGDVVIPPSYGDFSGISQEEQTAIKGRLMRKINGFQVIPGQILEGPANWKPVAPHVEKWGVFGLCFGGKVVALTSREGTPFVVSGQAHPSFIQPDDPKLMVIPHICLASKDEAPVDIDMYKAILGDKGYVATYPESIHGWMGTRCNLKDSRQKASFDRGYNQVADFFNSHF
ncbi:hypothetical protein Dda_5691 [Drechslerella dactyloides]|uniref:Dienelactone hydrolase domain-containing protein n=1 Tax=Drechslerella dactyloides TaxID=74499 RepID=A0AAD6IWJ6_DREDA|nr:hypothetical protein Dda_5691 [Drechslerella dactyloides]